MTIAGIPFDCVLFALTLLGVALFHARTLQVALAGAAAITLYQWLVTGFKGGAGLAGLTAHVGHEWITLANLLGPLIGFAMLADHFEKSRLPDHPPRFLPDDWKGGFTLLIGVFLMSGILDNIAAAMIGGAVALSIFGVIAARQQHAYQPIQKDYTPNAPIDGPRLMIVALVLVAAIGANVWCNLNAPELLGHLPVIGKTAVLALLLTAPLRAPHWGLLPGAFKGSVFLLSLVWCASLMPVQHLPAASWPTALGLGFVSAVFDNIPLTALAIRQDGYDWGFLAYAVGFGGSMIWFGSSASVALSNMYPEARSVGARLKGGWHGHPIDERAATQPAVAVLAAKP